MCVMWCVAGCTYWCSCLHALVYTHEQKISNAQCQSDSFLHPGLFRLVGVFFFLSTHRCTVVRAFSGTCFLSQRLFIGGFIRQLRASKPGDSTKVTLKRWHCTFSRQLHEFSDNHRNIEVRRGEIHSASLHKYS